MLQLITIKTEDKELAIRLNKLLKRIHVPYNTDHNGTFVFVILVDIFQKAYLDDQVSNVFNADEWLGGFDISITEIG